MIQEWQPTAPLSNLQLRAKILKKIRLFFEEKDVLEVETPLICEGAATDPSIASFETAILFDGSHPNKKFLQTSPEFAMKRLLAAGYGSIYQICKAFRNGETGKRHNPEFTILEWYRVNYDHFQLMDEMDELLTLILGVEKGQRISYHDLFYDFFSINPHTCEIAVLKKIAAQHDIIFASNDIHDKDMWLDLILTHVIEPQLGQTRPLYIYHYPETQAALAKIKQEGDYRVGERFEVYFKGIELANGYHELGDATEQLARFSTDNETRQKKGLPIIPIDKHFLHALATFPACAGVALGLDRLILLAAQAETISEILAFPIGRA